MSQHYASATSWYIEAKEEHSFENEYCSESQETTMLGAESGRKYHYEAHSHGSAVHISDGITAWDFHPDKEEYRKQPAPAGPDFSSQSSYPAEAVVVQAVGLRKYFAELASHYNSAPGCLMKCFTAPDTTFRATWYGSRPLTAKIPHPLESPRQRLCGLTGKPE